MTKNTPANKDEPATVEQPKPNHTEKIKSQVLAKIGNAASIAPCRGFQSSQWQLPGKHLGAA